MLEVCTAPDCTTLTIGPFCVTHDPSVAEPRVFPRGRPYRLEDCKAVSVTRPRRTRVPTRESELVLLEGAS